MKEKFVVPFVLVLAAFISRAFAAEDFLISAINGSNQIGPAIAYNSTDDQYLVVWEDDRTLDDSGFDIYSLWQQSGSVSCRLGRIEDQPGQQRERLRPVA